MDRLVNKENKKRTLSQHFRPPHREYVLQLLQTLYVRAIEIGLAQVHVPSARARVNLPRQRTQVKFPLAGAWRSSKVKRSGWEAEDFPGSKEIWYSLSSRE